MKKIWIGLTAAVLVMGIGTVGAYAATIDNNGTGKSENQNFFERMLPYAKQMHPDLSDEQIKEMYDNCHGGNGTQGMMGTSPGRSGMMNF
ncbi:FAD/FMN-containing dehydrogenase [Fontibacillus sp. BL9]|uniref:FAD/FMN-containing dehydrogenase n=1 Tax=Fontibacillus sp. BL9 TaxID=3389971 RepID=UPI00397CA798